MPPGTPSPASGSGLSASLISLVEVSAEDAEAPSDAARGA